MSWFGSASHSALATPLSAQEEGQQAQLQSPPTPQPQHHQHHQQQYAPGPAVVTEPDEEYLHHHHHQQQQQHVATASSAVDQSFGGQSGGGPIVLSSSSGGSSSLEQPCAGEVDFLPSVSAARGGGGTQHGVGQQQFSSLNAPVGLWTQQSTRRGGAAGGGGRAIENNNKQQHQQQMILYGNKNPKHGDMVSSSTTEAGEGSSVDLLCAPPQATVCRIGVFSVSGSPGKSAFIHSLLRVVHPVAAETGELEMPVVGKCGSHGTLRNKAYDIDVPFVSISLPSPSSGGSLENSPSDMAVTTPLLGAPAAAPSSLSTAALLGACGLRWRLIDTPGRELFVEQRQANSSKTSSKKKKIASRSLLRKRRRMQHFRSEQYLEAVIRGLKLEQNLTEKAEAKLRARLSSDEDDTDELFSSSSSEDDDDDDDSSTNTSSSSSSSDEVARRRRRRLRHNVFQIDPHEALDLIVLVVDARDLITSEETASKAGSSVASAAVAPAATPVASPQENGGGWLSGVFSRLGSGSSSSKTTSSVAGRENAVKLRPPGDARRVKALSRIRRFMDLSREYIDDRPPLVVVTHADKVCHAAAEFGDVDRLIRASLEKDCVPRRHCFVLCCDQPDDDDGAAAVADDQDDAEGGEEGCQQKQENDQKLFASETAKRVAMIDEVDVSATTKKSPVVVRSHLLLSDCDDDDDDADADGGKDVRKSAAIASASAPAAAAASSSSSRPSAASQFDAWNRLIQVLTSYSTTIATKKATSENAAAAANASRSGASSVSAGTPYLPFSTSLLPFNVSAAVKGGPKVAM